MKLGLIPKLLIGIVIGVLIGSYAPDAVIRLSETVRIFLGNLIKFIIPLIIVAFVSAAIAEFGERAGKMLTWTVGISYVSTIIACVLGAAVAYAVIPMLAPEAATAAKAAAIGKAYIQIDMPPVMAVMSALILAFLVGLGVTWTKSPSLRSVLNESRDIVALIIKRLMIPLVPWFVGSIFVQLAAKGDLFATALIFGKMLVLIVVLQWIWLLIQYLSAGAYAKENSATRDKPADAIHIPRSHPTPASAKAAA